MQKLRLLLKRHRQKVLPKVEAAIKDYNNGDSISLWDSADDDMENAYIAYTSDAVRVANANNFIGKKDRFQLLDEKIQNVLKWINIASSVAVVAVMVAKGIVLAVKTFCAGAAACAGLSSFLAGASTILAFASTAMAWVGLAVLAFTIAWALAKWISSLIIKKDPTLKHSRIPEYVFDLAETPEGRFTVKYRCVRDEFNSIGDLNARQQENWAVLCATTDPAVGSPIRADDSGGIFRVLYGTGNKLNGYDCVNFFGERNPANLNYLTKKDNNGGVYLSYRTERSVTQAAPAPDEGTETQTAGTTNYLSDIVVGVGSSANEARAKIRKRSGAYYILDQNLSPGSANYTYLGYTITTDPEDAITDIRVAPYQGNGNIFYGDVEYTFIGHVGLDLGADTSQTAGDAILKTKDKKAGSPIIADGLHIVNDHSKATPGWEPVTMFSGLPYDFTSEYYSEEADQTRTDYQTVSGRKSFDKFDWDHRDKCVVHKPVYLYFEPTEQYTGGEKYLAGVFFLNGLNAKQSDWMEDDGVQYWDFLLDEVKRDPNCWVNKDVNLWQAVILNKYSLRQYIGFRYTYNPKRAITDITAFQGDTYTESDWSSNWTQLLPYAYTKPSYETGKAMGYTAATTVMLSTQHNYESKIHHYYISRYNQIYGPTACGFMGDREGDFSKGYTMTLPEGFDYAFTKSNIIPAGLYLSGPAAGKEPLKLSDVVISTKRFNGTQHDGVVTFDVTGKTLAGQEAQGAFRSIAEIKHPHSTTAFDIASPTWYNKKDEKYANAPMFIYIRENGSNVVRKYISSIGVGSYSKSQYQKDMEKLSQTVEDSDLKKAQDSVNFNAMLSASCAGADELICINLSCAPEDAWYHRTDIEGFKDRTDRSLTKVEFKKDVPASYMCLTRTDKKSEAITGVLLYQNDDDITARQLKINRVDYYCDSTSSPILMNGKKYYVYYTRNRGVNNGVPIEGINVDDWPLGQNGEFGALCAKKGSDMVYGDPDLPYFFHLENSAGTGSYITELYLGQGIGRTDGERKALSDLLSQGCFRYYQVNLNEDAVTYYNYPVYLYLGYTTGYLPPDATEEDKEDAWYEAIYDIIITEDEPYHSEGFVCEKNNIFYAPVQGVSLNEGNDYGDRLYMYYCSPYRSARYNKEQKKAKTGIVTALPQDVFSAPISKIAFSMYDRVPYLVNSDGTAEEGSDPVPWEYVMLASHECQADLNSGTRNFTGGFAVDNRLNMFVQRYDGSVKPAAEITGGFVSAMYEIGNLVGY